MAASSSRVRKYDGLFVATLPGLIITTPLNP